MSFIPQVFGAGTPAAGEQALADYVAQVLLAAQVGSVGTIPNALASGALNTAILTDPGQIQAFRSTVADQMNAQSGGPRFEDLSDRITDLVITDTAQGAGTLEVTIADPLWLIPNSGFIQSDENGLLWPPIDINLPSGTDCYWRLCQFRGQIIPTGDQGNLVLTSEDRIVSILRQMSAATGGIVQGQPNQTLGGFIKQLVDSANSVLKVKPPIRLVELISPNDPNYTAPITNLPTSAQSPLRQNPNKTQQGVTAAQQATITSIDQVLQRIFGGLLGKQVGQVLASNTPAPAKSTTLAEAEQTYLLQMGEITAGGTVGTGGAGHQNLTGGATGVTQGTASQPVN